MFFKGTVYGVNGGKHSYLIITSTKEKALKFLADDAAGLGAISTSLDIIADVNYIRMEDKYAKQFDGIQYVE